MSGPAEGAEEAGADARAPADDEDGRAHGRARSSRADELIDAWEAAWSGRDPAAFRPIVTGDVHYEDPLTELPLRGADELVAHARRLWTSFPDAALERSGRRLADGEFLAAPARLRGTNRGALGAMPATNRVVTVHCVFYCEVRHGLLCRVRGFFDLYEAATQLGVLPRHGTVGERALLMLRGFGLRARRD